MPFLLLVWSRAFEIKQYQSTLGQTVSVKSSSGDYILAGFTGASRSFRSLTSRWAVARSISKIELSKLPSSASWDSAFPTDILFPAPSFDTGQLRPSAD